MKVVYTVRLVAITLVATLSIAVCNANVVAYRPLTDMLHPGATQYVWGVTFSDFASPDASGPQPQNIMAEFGYDVTGPEMLPYVKVMGNWEDLLDDNRLVATRVFYTITLDDYFYNLYGGFEGMFLTAEVSGGVPGVSPGWAQVSAELVSPPNPWYSRCAIDSGMPMDTVSGFPLGKQKSVRIFNTIGLENHGSVPTVKWFKEGFSIPEPSSLALLGVGALGLLPMLRRRRA